MAELLRDGNIKVICFYLPQFHSIPENDKAYGKGFVEWTNTKKAAPLFEGHYQPRTPYQYNYYNLLDNHTMFEQSEMAQKYGVWGFCYYHYWFKDGKKLLEKPIENMLKDRSITIPFCLCWANENWSKRWDGGNKEIIVAQDYGNQSEWDIHMDYLIDFFRDERYITVDGKPLIIIYKPELIPKLKKMLKYFDEYAKTQGLKGLCFAVQHPAYYLEGHDMNLFDYYIGFEPEFSRDKKDIMENGTWRTNMKRIMVKAHLGKIANSIRAYRINRANNREKSLTVIDYDDAWNNLLNMTENNKKFLPGAFVDWDNTPRNKTGIAYHGASPEKFEYYCKQLVNKVKRSKNLNVIFINAWNEWAEGAYLEPDEKYGMEYLKALQSVISEDGDK